ncbi:DUF655 domain-containing protein [Candidatus Woesearchaeota archaeon]|nr:DUF655 domain-containing protein [Candidatus Woesearchaeota archaeon]
MTFTKEEKAIVLDFLPNGYSYDSRPNFRKTPIVQAVGVDHFTILELVPKETIFLKPHDEIYIGEGKRDKIHHVNGKIPITKLTGTAKAELHFVVEEILQKNEAQFVAFFNKAVPLSTRMHQLELLPGVGKKHMWQILEEKKERPFTSFEDLRNRVKLIPDPVKTVAKRVLKELEGNEKHYLFVDQERG